MTKDTETLGLVHQNENFNYNHYANYGMDSWNYLESPMTDLRRSMSGSHQTEDMTTLSMLYEQCKNLKDRKMSPCHDGSSVYEPTERTLSNSSPELVSLKTSPGIVKMPSDNVPSSLPLEATTSPVCSPAEQSVSLPVSEPPASAVYATLTTASVLADTHYKQDLKNIFDSQLLQKWPAGAFPEANAEALPYSDPFSSEDRSSPVYSDSNSSSSPPEGYGSEFQFTLGAPPATPPKPCELPTVYLNKGQFYPITLHGVDGAAGLAAVATVKTVVMAVFENDNRTPEAQLRCWNHWHTRQPTIKQRVIDIADYKEGFSGISHVEDVAFNALSFIRNPSEDATVYVCINSLSTDFSSQKGVKGLPLNLQIDTYDFSTGTDRLIHRAACQIKIFCDKGAERKMRDEERRRMTKKRGAKKNSKETGANKGLVSGSVSNDCTFLQAVDDRVTQPVLFVPETHLTNLQRCGLAAPLTTLDEVERRSVKRSHPDGDQSSPPLGKRAREDDSQRVLLYVRTETEEVFDALVLNRPTVTGLREAISEKYGMKQAREDDSQRVLLYVRAETEEAFHALVLNSPTVTGLREAILEKYGMQKDTVGNIFKKCKRGIFVNMDDNIIEHYSNRSAFLIDIAEATPAGQFQITLTEL